MKIRLKMKNRSHRYDINRPRPRHGHKYNKYKCGAVMWWLRQLHSLVQQSLDSGSAQVQVLLAVCWRLAMVRISDRGPGWK